MEGYGDSKGSAEGRGGEGGDKGGQALREIVYTNGKAGEDAHSLEPLCIGR